MVKPMERRELSKLLKAAGFVRSEGRGDHEKWKKGSQQVVITQTRVISPGLTRKALQAIEAAKKEDGQ